MIIVFGELAAEVEMTVDNFPGDGEAISAQSFHIGYGGHAGWIAAAISRAGAKVAVVGKVGDDLYGEELVDTLRRSGVMTSGIALSELSTGCVVRQRDARRAARTVLAYGANNEVSARQVPSEILTPANLLVTHTGLDAGETLTLLERARAENTPAVLYATDAGVFLEEYVANAAYIVFNRKSAQMISRQLGLPHFKDDALGLAAFLAEKGGITAIVTLGAKGCVAVDKGHVYRIPTLDLGALRTKFYAGDVFCGTLASALHARLGLRDALSRATIAATQACAAEDGVKNLPYIADIERLVAELPPPEVIAVALRAEVHGKTSP